MQQFELLFPLALIVLIGILSARFKLVPKDAYIPINKVVIFIAMPALTLSGLITIKAEDIAKFPMFTLANTVAMIVFGLLMFFILSRSRLPYEKWASIYMSVMEGNVVYFGYPIILGLFGQTYLNYAAIWVATVLQIAATFNAFLLTAIRGEKFKFKQIIINFFKNPFVISTFAGFLIFYIVQVFPKDIQAVNVIAGTFGTALSKVGGLTSTLALFSLGIFLYSNFKINTVKLSLVASFLRLMILPAWILLIVLYVFGLDKTAVETSVLLAAMPTAVFAIIASDVYEYDKNQTANSLIVSSILFIATLPVWLWVISSLKLT